MRFSKTLSGACGALLLGMSVGLAAQGSGQESTMAGKGQEDKSAESAAGAQRGRRDPFEALVRKSTAGQGQQRVLPAGIGGVEVSTMRLDGLVKAANGMIAVVSTPQNRVYFVREGDRLYDGTVERITLEGIVVRARGQDAFGKPVDRLVTKSLNPSAGDGR